MSSSDISIKAQAAIEETSTNPYVLVKKINQVIADQKLQIEEYEAAFVSYQKEKEIILAEKKKLEEIAIESLEKIELMKMGQSSYSNGDKSKNLNINLTSIQIFNNIMISPTNRKHEFATNRPFERIEASKSNLYDLVSNATKRAEESQPKMEDEYVPPPIKLSSKSKNEKSVLSILNTNSLENFNKKEFKYAENMLETFLVIGPEMSEFKTKRNNEKGKDEITVKPCSLYSYDGYYKEKKMEFIAEISKRAFPEGCKLKKKLLQYNGEELSDIIEHKPNHNLSEDYFIFTLKGDESLFKMIGENPALKKTFLYSSNPNFFLFVVCLKLPDFIYVRDEKNYQRKEDEVWVGEKIYAIASYYPFFHVHTEILCKIHSIMYDVITQKVIIDGENTQSWNIAKSVYNLEKNDQILEILSYFSTKKPDYNQVCYHSSHYFGTLPEFGYKSIYSMSLYTCPVFFSNFCYEELLLLLTAVFCQKTLIFLSKVETMATLSALFLINLISPFQYSEPLLLNCDSEKVKEMIFEFPFAMICSIKKTDENIEEILELFAESNIMRSSENDAQYIIIDVDSNSILYHHVLGTLFNGCVVSPNENIRQAYKEVNSCESKSFSLPKTLVRENFKPSLKQKSEIERRREEMKKCVKEYQEKISTNQTKIPSYRRTEKHTKVLKLLTDHVQDYIFTSENDYEIMNKLEKSQKNNRIDMARNHLLEKFKNRSAIINYLVESQMYANYLDSIFESG